MDLITIDFETYYDKDFSLFRKMTTEEYIRDERFEVIGVGVKVNNQPTQWASGTYEETKQFLNTFDWANSLVVAHNAMFDCAILSWHYGISLSRYSCTLCIARALHGVEVGGSLKVLAERYRLRLKGTAVADAKGKRREDFTVAELSAYGDYCVDDVEICFGLFRLMGKNFPKSELRLIHATLRMFVEPVLELDGTMLNLHLQDVKTRKEELLQNCATDKKELMSNPKFARLLAEQGVAPPRKISPSTGKETFAFAKTDKAFLALSEHPDPQVQALVAARLGTKSTLEETRTERFIGISKRGLLPVPIKYYAAHTGRWGGDDKINLQNLPSRGKDGKKLKKGILAPKGYTLVDCDSSQIEARVLAWLAGQEDLVQAFRDKKDVYKKMAAKIYGVFEEKDIIKEQRFVGKTTILGAGYGMAAQRFKEQLRAQTGVVIDLPEAQRIIKIYREENWKIVQFWRDCQNMLVKMFNREPCTIGKNGLITVDRTSVMLPNGLAIRYDELDYEQGGKGKEFSYKTRKGRARIYGGAMTENICQALARIIIGEQFLLIEKRYRVLMTVHDSLIVAVPDAELAEGQAYVERCMRHVPAWCEGLPLECESGAARAYGDCE